MNDADRTEYLMQMAAELELTLPEAELTRVKIMFGVLERAAGSLREVPMADEVIGGAVFRAQPGRSND
jgi:hypothetical protein